MSLALLLALPFIGSVVAALLPANARNTAATWAAAVAFTCAAGLASMFPAVRDGGVIREASRGCPRSGLELVLRVDGFAWMFAVLVTGIGALVALYARYYMSPDDPVPRFFSFFLAFMGAMLGVVLSGNLIQLVVLLGADEPLLVPADRLLASPRRRATRRAHGADRDRRRRACACSPASSCSATSSAATTSTRCSPSGDLIRAHALYPVALVLVLLGAFTKSAQFPFHFWLPHAMAAPTPVSAYLHSATMVKAGVFLLARLWPVLSGTELWFWLVGGAGRDDAAARRVHRDVPARPQARCSPTRRSATSA